MSQGPRVLRPERGQSRWEMVDLDSELFFDPKLTPPSAPLHPTAEGQALMAEAIEPTLAALLGDKGHMAARLTLYQP